MSDSPRTPVAQYPRMSKEQQQYSLANQTDMIKRYAYDHGFEIVTTYADAGRSGLLLKHRTGLARLLQDVVGGTQPCLRLTPSEQKDCG